MVLLVANRVRAACLVAPVCSARRRCAAQGPAAGAGRRSGRARRRRRSTSTSRRFPTSGRTTSRSRKTAAPVEIKTFAQVIALGSLQPDDARVVSLLMDDVGVGITGTSAMQQIAQALLSPLGRGDELSVVRLSQRRRRGVRRLQHRARSHRRLPRRHGAVLAPRHAGDGRSRRWRRSRSSSKRSTIAGR